MLQFSLNLSLIFTELPLLERFQAANDHGFDAVEIQFPYEVSVEDLKQAIDSAGVQLILFNVAADDLLQGGEGLAAVPEKRTAFYGAVDSAIEYARILKPRCINVLPGRANNPAVTERYLETLEENLRFAAEKFSHYGIRTVFEAANTIDMRNFLISSGQQMLDMLGRVDHPNLYLQYDLYHMCRMHEDVSKFITEQIDKIAHFQFADAPGRGQPGTGTIDFNSLFRTISDTGYCGWLGAEYNPNGPSEKSFEWFRAYRHN